MFFRVRYHLVLWSFLIFITILGFMIPSPVRASFTNTGASLTGVFYSSAAWGDYDNDGDLDILITGSSSSGRVSKIYRNDNGTFTEDASNSLPGVRLGSGSWGDYDNDGDLDILLTGEAASGFVSKIYRNNGGTFTEDISNTLTGVFYSSAAWGDYDNDGDLDILLTGSDGSSRVSKIYRNDGGTFTDSGIALTGVVQSSAAWGDYDNDGDLDILLTGGAGAGPVSIIYRNDGGTFTDSGIALTGVALGSAAWGDYDNDGDLDILLTGDTGPVHVSKIYRNDGGTFTDSGIALTGVSSSSTAWGDYDNDGDLDILITGEEVVGTRHSIIYRNDGGTFTDSGIALTNVSGGSAAWGDYDNDGYLDILLTGVANSNYISRIYRNDGGGTVNTLPTPPTVVASTFYNQKAILLWDGASDAQTPSAGLTYNIRVGTTSGGVDVVSPLADASSGWRKIPAMGRCGHLNYTVIENLDMTKEYYWSVQAVDSAFEGSVWSTESYFSALKTLTVVKAGSGSGTVTSNPTGIDCGVDCSEAFAVGASITLTATADTGSVFTGWSGAGCSGTGDCTVTMDAAKSVVADFDTLGTATNTTTVVGGGSGGGSGGCFVSTVFSDWTPW